MSHSHPAGVTLSVRVPPKIREQLEKLADATGRKKSFLAAEALETYLALQNWQVAGIEKALRKADSKTAQFTDHQQVNQWLESWGSENELDAPE